MAARTVRVIVNGASGEIVRRQHLPALMAIRDEGGLSLANGDRIIPDVILVGRTEERLKEASAATGFPCWTTNLDDALASPENRIFFDAAPSGGRAGRVKRAIAAGKHVYCEKPIAESVEEAVALSGLAAAAGVKHGVVQDKLYLPGFHALWNLRRAGFFGRILEVRIEMGRWIFDGGARPSQRPSWNYRRGDGGGLILDMFPHWRYMVDHLAGEIRAVSAICRTQIPRRWDESGRPFEVDVEDSVFARMELEGGAIASVNCSWAMRVRREFPIEVQIDGTDASAVAGPFACWTQRAGDTPGGIVSSAVRGSDDPRAGWQAAEIPVNPVNSYRAGWELFIRHLEEGTPFPYPLREGAKGVQLAELAYRSDRERRWIDVPALD